LLAPQMARASIAFLVLIVATFAWAAEYRVLVGYEGTGTSNGWFFNDYYPDFLTINVGDSVVFQLNAEVHTVTFSPNPLPTFVNVTTDGSLIESPLLNPTGGHTVSSQFQVYSSGLLTPANPTYFFNFTEVGVFQYFCVLHPPFMTGIVNVINATFPIATPAEIALETQALLTFVQNSTIPILTTVKATDDTVPASRPSGNGLSTIWTVRMVGDVFSRASYLRYVPQTLVIAVNDTIEFVNDGIDIHTATFNSSGVFAPPTGVVEGNIAFLPSATLRIGGLDEVYTGGFANSGFLFPLFYPNPLLTPVHSWSITFGAAGTFPFRCDIHGTVGMVGSVTVGNPMIV
jgi:plastocyanin